MYYDSIIERNKLNTAWVKTWVCREVKRINYLERASGLDKAHSFQREMHTRQNERKAIAAPRSDDPAIKAMSVMVARPMLALFALIEALLSWPALGYAFQPALGNSGLSDQLFQQLLFLPAMLISMWVVILLHGAITVDRDHPRAWAKRIIGYFTAFGLSLGSALCRLLYSESGSSAVEGSVTIEPSQIVQVVAMFSVSALVLCLAAWISLNTLPPDPGKKRDYIRARNLDRQIEQYRHLLFQVQNRAKYLEEMRVDLKVKAQSAVERRNNDASAQLQAFFSKLKAKQPDLCMSPEDSRQFEAVVKDMVTASQIEMPFDLLRVNETDLFLAEENPIDEVAINVC
jgi:hypothetical protein